MKRFHLSYLGLLSKGNEARVARGKGRLLGKKALIKRNILALIKERNTLGEIVLVRKGQV